MKTKKTTKKPNDIEKNIETVAIISEFESEDKSLKAVLKMNKLTSLYDYGVGVGTQEGRINPLALDWCSRLGSNPSTPTNKASVVKR